MLQSPGKKYLVRLKGRAEVSVAEAGWELGMMLEELRGLHRDHTGLCKLGSVPFLFPWEDFRVIHAKGHMIRKIMRTLKSSGESV